MRRCKLCDKRINGRADKLYCSPLCKAKAHRQKHRPIAKIEAINKILKNNHGILNRLFANTKNSKMTIDHLALTEQGFQFNYCTRVYLNNQGKWYRYVYEYRWIEFSDQKVIVYKS